LQRVGATDDVPATLQIVSRLDEKRDIEKRPVSGKFWILESQLSVDSPPTVRTLAFTPAVTVTDTDSVHNFAVSPEINESASILTDAVAEQQIVLLFHHGTVRKIHFPEKRHVRQEETAGGKPDTISVSGLQIIFFPFPPGPLSQEFLVFRTAPAVMDVSCCLKWLMFFDEG
jgi:hypothetical protein